MSSQFACTSISEKSATLVQTREPILFSIERTEVTGLVIEGPIAKAVTSPDGLKTLNLKQVATGVETLSYALSIIDHQSRHVTELGNITNFFSAAWSPDSTFLAFSEGSLVHLVASDGENRREIFRGRGGPYPGASVNLTWSADGRILTFVELQHAGRPELQFPQKIILRFH